MAITKQTQPIVATPKKGFDPLRPFRYIGAFIRGTTAGTLDGIARWGRKGLKWGIIIGIASMFMPPLAAIYPALAPIAGMMGTFLAGYNVTIGTSYIASAFVFGAASFVASMVAGGAKGLLTGGIKAVNRLRHVELYGETRAMREEAQKRAPLLRRDPGLAARQRDMESDIMTQQLLERESEARRDSMSWRDYVMGERHHGRGMGL